jgi:hypothetical protein
MKCKPGDLAIVLRGFGPNSPQAGKIVEVLHLIRKKSKLGPVWAVRFSHAVPCVTLKKNLEMIGPDDPGRDVISPDAWLQPIRDQPGADETLEWAPAPAPLVLELEEV